MADRPHILTPEEIERRLPNADYKTIPVVMEEKVPFGVWTCGSIIKWVDSAFALEHYRDTLRHRPGEWYEYGKTMRFWSGMPTKKQSRETPWEKMTKAKLLTLKEALARDRVWLETRFDGVRECDWLNERSLVDTGDMIEIRRDENGFSFTVYWFQPRYYGVTERAWDERPDDETRRATPWEPWPEYKH